MLGPGVGALRQGAVDRAAGQGFQQCAALVVVRLQKRGKLVLRQQHGARELLERQANALRDLSQHLAVGAAQRLQPRQLVQCHGGFLQAAIGLAAGAPHGPAGAQGLLVGADKVDLGIALGAAAPQQVAGVLLADGVLAHVGQVLLTGLDQAGRAFVEGHAQRVQQRTFAGAGGAADGEQAGGLERLQAEVHVKLARQGGQVFTADGKDLHAAPASSASSSSANAAPSAAGVSVLYLLR